MSDAAFTQLLCCLPEDRNSRVLLLLDENFDTRNMSILTQGLQGYNACQILSNRFDIAACCNRSGINCHFNDFELSRFSPESFDHVLLRVAKEKPLTNHLINAASRLLTQGGQLHLAGFKQDGTKSYISNAGALLGNPTQATKHGNVYTASICKRALSSDLLDDKNYSQLINIAKNDQPAIYSKPGMFGWNKIDQGSALLAGYLGELLGTLQLQCSPVTVLDMGCGYGYLSLMAQQCGLPVTITATDNCAAAIVACQKNFNESGISGEVIASDCGGNIDRKFQLVVSHPPFHRGFDTDMSLTRRFVGSAHAHLLPGGVALMVANSFVPLEKFAADSFRTVNVRTNNRQFKIVEMRK